jgi:hypothetical protein
MCVFMPKVERAKAWFYAYHDVSLKDDLIECEDCIMAQWEFGNMKSLLPHEWNAIAKGFL